MLRKYGKAVETQGIDYTVLTYDVSYNVVKIIGGYEDAIMNSAEKYEPSVVARYVISLATAFNKFYHDCSILQAGEKETIARLLLVDSVRKVLREACGLLGMECPEEM